MAVTAIVTDVTRMHGRNVCIAVIGLRQRETMRLDTPPPTEDSLTAFGGLSPGDVVRLNWTGTQRVQRPHTEDGSWDNLSKIRNEGEDSLAEFLAPLAVDGVTRAYGRPFLRAKNGNAAFQPGRGKLSLATIRAKTVEILQDGAKARVRFRDSSGDAWSGVPLNDLSVIRHRDECRRCRPESAWIANLRREFQDGPALLRLGLSREFAVGDYPEACWLQVNHIVLRPSRRRHFAS